MRSERTSAKTMNNVKFILKLAVLAVMAVIILTACTKTTQQTSRTNQTTSTKAPEVTLDPSLLEKTDKITITLTNGEVIKADLYPDVAPITVANFEKLISENFYDGLIFHRVISGFMIQGGGYDENLTEKQSDRIKGEFSANGVENNLKHTRGVLSMARTPDMDSASSQFFIMHDDAPHLDGQYAAFGMVTEGMDVVDEIANAQTESKNGMSDVPVEPIVIQTITLD
jgi:peptidyl-prolyl cis-trans isomerase B (cyclophilin B)